MLEWYSGLDNYRKHTLEFGEDRNIFTVELLDKESKNVSTVQDAFQMHLDGANLPVEVLYSGGLDSECVIKFCLEAKIPVKAITQRLMVRGAPINMSDLYYAEKFSRTHNVEHHIVDLDIESFYNNGDHIPYLERYKCTRFTVATLFHLLKNCTSFPVIGGDYSWPQTNIGRKLYSPHRHDYMCYDLFMQENGINGIGNMLSHSIDSNVLFIKEHLETYSEDITYKHNIFCNLGFNLEKRHRSYGWENLKDYSKIIDWDSIHGHLVTEHNLTTSVIKWNKTFADLIDGEPGKNDDFVI